MSTDSTTPTPADSPPKKKLWEIVLTSTPVLLTVIATLLASRSSGELTQSQYARTIAGQNQSKAGDQWAFFQAKRIRGTIQQMFAERGAFRPAGALIVANRLPKAIERTGPEATALLDAVDAALKMNGGSEEDKADLEALKKAVEKYQTEVKTAVKQAEESRAALAKVLSAKDAAADKTKDGASITPAQKDAAPPNNLSFLTSTALPKPADEPTDRARDVVDAAVDRDILEALVLSRAVEAARLIRDDNPKEEASAKEQKLKTEVEKLEKAAAALPREDKAEIKVNVPSAGSFADAVKQMEAELTRKQKKLDAAKIEHAIEAAEAKANKFDKSADPATGAIRNLEGLLGKQETVMRSVQAAVEEVQMTVADLSTTNGKLSEVRKTADALNTSVARLAANTASVSNRFKAARCDYDVRRYDREARFNQELAVLYEMQVRKASLSADVHRERSAMYFYAMLAAQAGVMIATFSLAMRQQSIMWSLATAAGVTAISIAATAFLTM